MGKLKDEPYKKRKISENSEVFVPLPSTIQLVASGFPENISEERVKKLFKSCGQFSVLIPQNSKGVVILSCSSEDSAEKALGLNGGTYKEKTLFINKTKDLPSVRREKPVATPVFIGNLKSNTTDEQLRSFFSGAGKIKSIRLNTEKGFAHVDFTSKYSAQLAEKLVGGKLNGQKIRIEVADKKNN